MINLFKKLAGTTLTQFKLGLAGVIAKSTGTDVAQVRNSDDSGFARLQGGAPIDANDFATRGYVDSRESTMIVSRQADTSVSLPNNTAVEGFVVVSTPGTGAVVGDVLVDDGTNSGTMTIFGKVDGREIFTTVALAGGTVTFVADAQYNWDETTTAWIKTADIGSVSGAERKIRFVVGTAAIDSSEKTPANSRVSSTRFEVTTPYNGGATIAIGNAADTDAYMETGDLDPQTAGAYEVEDDIDSGVEDEVSFTPTGATSGAGIVTVTYSLPNG